MKNHLKPYADIERSDPDSYPSRGAISLKTNGREKPARRVAEACIPGDPVNKSIVSPVRNEIIRTSHA
jgi:hypothetical protein